MSRSRKLAAPSSIMPSLYVVTCYQDESSSLLPYLFVFLFFFLLPFLLFITDDDRFTTRCRKLARCHRMDDRENWFDVRRGLFCIRCGQCLKTTHFKITNVDVNVDVDDNSDNNDEERWLSSFRDDVRSCASVCGIFL